MTGLLFQFWGLGIQFQSQDDYFYEIISELWSFFRADRYYQNTIHIHFDLRKLSRFLNDEYLFIVNNGELIISLKKETVVSFISSYLNELLLRQIEKFYFFHSASFVTHSNKLVLLVGESGSGKTSLLLWMLRNGHKYFANELTPMKIDSILAEPFSVGFLLEKKMIKLLPFLREFDITFSHRKESEKGGILFPEKFFGLAEQRTYPVSQIIFLERQHTGHSDLKSITQGNAIGRLFENWKNQQPFTKDSLNFLHQLTDDTELYVLKNENFEKSVQLIEEIL